MAAPLGPRLSQFEQQVLSKIDQIIAGQGGGPPVDYTAILATIEDHLRYLRLTDMRRFGQVGDPAVLPPATVDQP